MNIKAYTCNGDQNITFGINTWGYTAGYHLIISTIPPKFNLNKTVIYQKFLSENCIFSGR